MKKILIAVLSVILILALPVIGLPVYAAILPDVYGATYLAAMADKYERLHSVSGEKIILVGGSSMAFGVDSGAVERELDMPVVNMALYAALGSKTTLDLTFGGIDEGDIVVFAPELDTQAYSLYTDAEITVQTLEANKKMTLDIPLSQWPSLFCELPNYIKSKKDLIASGIPSPENAYSRAAFNEYGDNAYARPYNIMPDLYMTTNVIDVSHDLVNIEFIDYVNDYAEKVARRGAKFYFSFPPINRLALTDDSIYERRTDVYARLVELLDCTVIGNIEDHIMHEGYFYDSNYHLNDSGVPYNTKKLVGDIKRALGDTSATDIEILPPSGAQQPDDPSDGDDTYSDLYEYSEQSGGYAVVSVKDEAKGQDVLRLPKTYQGKTVYKIARGAFDGCAASRIIIGDNITVFDDGAFSGCANLTRVDLSVKLGASDALPQVGDNLLDGANPNIKIYVPSAKYGAMCADYFWMKYSAYLQIADRA